MTLGDLNGMAEAAAAAELKRCCGSSAWVRAMLARRPWPDRAELLAAARSCWGGTSEADWLEAFSHHPKIGGKDALREKFAATKSWSAGEQAGAAGADERVLDALAAGNAAYERKFGFIFIVCATGKTAAQMLSLLESRLKNDRDVELRVAAGEQAKITTLRLEKLLS